MKFMECKANNITYAVDDSTLDKTRNYRNITLHDVLEQRMGYNFVFSYRYTDEFGAKKKGYKTVWQDRVPNEEDVLWAEIHRIHEVKQLTM